MTNAFINQMRIKKRQPVLKHLRKENNKGRARKAKPKYQYISRLILYNPKLPHFSEIEYDKNEDYMENSTLLKCNPEWPICLYDHTYKIRCVSHFAYRARFENEFIDKYLKKKHQDEAKEKIIDNEEIKKSKNQKYDELMIERGQHYCDRELFVYKMKKILEVKGFPDKAFPPELIDLTANDYMEFKSVMTNYIKHIEELEGDFPEQKNYIKMEELKEDNIHNCIPKQKSYQEVSEDGAKEAENVNIGIKKIYSEGEGLSMAGEGVSNDKLDIKVSKSEDINEEEKIQYSLDPDKLNDAIIREKIEKSQDSIQEDQIQGSDKNEQNIDYEINDVQNEHRKVESNGDKILNDENLQIEKSGNKVFDNVNKEIENNKNEEAESNEVIKKNNDKCINEKIENADEDVKKDNNNELSERIEDNINEKEDNNENEGIVIQEKSKEIIEENKEEVSVSEQDNLKSNFEDVMDIKEDTNKLNENDKKNNDIDQSKEQTEPLLIDGTEKNDNQQEDN